MFRIITTVVITVIVVLFSIQNFDHVPVYLLWGKAANIRLIFVIGISGAIGYIIRLFIGIAKEERMKRQLQTLVKRNNSVKKRIDAPDDEDL